MLKDRQKGVSIACLVVIAVGIWAWTRGYTGIPDATNLGFFAPWGLYIALFLFFEAVGAGALLMAAFYKNSEFRFPFAVAGCTAIASAGLAILMDLGGLTKAWRLLFSPNFSSPLLLDVWLMLLLLIFGVLLCVNLAQKKESAVISRCTGIVAVFLPIGTALLFTSLPGSPGWGSALELIMFLAQATLAGFACLLLYGKIGDEVVRRIFMAVLSINVLLIVAEIASALYSISAHALPILELLSGRYAVLFWLGILLCLLIPFLLAGKKPQWAGGFCLAGLLLSKYTFILKGKLLPYLFPGENLLIDDLQMSSSGYLQAPSYTPCWEEVVAALAVFAFFVLIFSNVIAKKTIGRNEKKEAYVSESAS